MNKRKLLGAVFSALIILSLAFSLTPFIPERAVASDCDCGNPHSCPGSGPPWGKDFNAPDCCCWIDDFQICHHRC